MFTDIKLNNMREFADTHPYFTATRKSYATCFSFTKSYI